MQANFDWYLEKSICVFEAEKFLDERGFFSEIYNKEFLANIGISDTFVQDNYSYSKEKYTLRGLHFQKYPHEQAKIVRVVKGRILDIVLDIRKDSRTYLKSLSFELSKENFSSIYIPRGYAHGFLTLEENCEVMYKTSDFYKKDSEISLSCFDDHLSIDLPVKKEEIILSEKDKNSYTLEEIEKDFR
mgnify:CR=1 FL=1